MALTAVHHIALLVSDYQKSKEFYVDKLGSVSYTHLTLPTT